MSVGSTEQAVFATYPSLRGRVAFVSGGASGLGAEFVNQLAGQGARVAFIDIDTDRGKALEQALRDEGADVVFSECDVRDVAALQAAIAQSAEELGPIRVLVNNAANDHRDKVAEMDQALWDDRIAVNVRHHFFAAQAVAEMMRDAGGGSIINLGSISAHIDLMDLPGYITAKAGVEGLTRTLARQYGPWHRRRSPSHATSASPTECIPTTLLGCCSGLPRTTPARVPLNGGLWTEAGCDTRGAVH
jgi:D-xylose 1-dehydrogenase